MHARYRPTGTRRRLPMSRWLLGFAATGALIVAGCNEGSGGNTSAGNSLNGLISSGTLKPPAQVVEQCADPEGGVCVWLAPGSGENASNAFADGSELGVFDAIQGNVATWFTVVIVGAPEGAYPTVVIDMKSEGESVNINNALLLPLKAESGYHTRRGYMINFTQPCCAIDYVGKAVDVSLVVQFEGLPTATYDFSATLTQVPFPE